MSKTNKTIEEIYQKKDLHQHILDRPDTYIGCNKIVCEEQYTYDNSKIIKKVVEYNPSLIKIFDEILVNAIDHTVRDKTSTFIKVDINPITNAISVMNNGYGIPIVKHKEHGVYIPEMIFGQLLTSSNYDDTDNRVVGGRNGLGAKACCIYSEFFAIETVDEERSLYYYQEFNNNMFNKSDPIVKKSTKKGYTKVSFKPDYKRFKLKKLTKDIISLLTKRVYDCTACTNKNISVYYNGEKLKQKDFQQYIGLYNKQEIAPKIIYESYCKNEFIWEYAANISENYDQVSFVNGIATIQGGRQVEYILNQIVKKLTEMINSKKKVTNIKPSYIKDRIQIFVRSTIVNPNFSSQTKEFLTTPIKDFGCKIEVSDQFITKLYKSGIVEDILSFTQYNNERELKKKTDGVNNTRRKVRLQIKNLDDANNAGTSKSKNCMLFLTEGLSAKTFAMSGLDIIGRENYGVFSLKGKCNSEDTKIPLFNGEIKLAKDIQIGDILIGDDGNQRTVLTLYKGNGKMYEVFQDRGESYKVNDEHILTLCIPEHKSIYWYEEHSSWRTFYWDKTIKNIKVKEIQISLKCNECGIMMNNQSLKRHYNIKHKNITFQKSKSIIYMNDLKVIEARKKLSLFLLDIDDNNIIDISIQDYLKLAETNQRKLKGIRGDCVNWEQKEILLDPYILGLWLGDGFKSGYGYSCNGEKDYKLIDYLKELCLKNDVELTLSEYNKYIYYISSIDNYKKCNYAPLKKILKEYNLVNNKHIPKEYLVNSKEIRLKVLAGIIDTDGYVAPDGTIEITQSVKVHQQLVDDIVYLSRSLGFYTYIKKKVTNYTYKTSGEKAEAYIIKISGDTEYIPTILPRKKSKSTTQYNMTNSTGPIKIKEIENCNYVGIGLDCNSRFVINDFTVTHNCLNVREATQKQLLENEEINNIKQIIGLQHGKKYTIDNIDKLRYNSICMLTDADEDGKHIRCLLINMFHIWWPELLEIPGFIVSMKTPIVKTRKGKDEKIFYTIKDYRDWEKATSNSKSWTTKYYKGLGTSTATEAKDIFKKIKTNIIKYISTNKDETDRAIILAFEKKQSDARKEWLQNYNFDMILDQADSDVSYSDLINKELIHFSMYDVKRSIPSLCDGLKPSQRKVLYTMFKKYSNIDKEIKVAQLGSSVSEFTSYHHGEVSLYGTIINMAQNYIGSNNINLLKPNGQFGSRQMNGKDAASPRYIYTELNKIAKDIFNKDDINILKPQYDDGQEIEPIYFIPILPMVLVNGAQGIGTGYSTHIPCYNPQDIISNMRLYLEGKTLKELKPWYKGYTGDIVKEENGNYTIKGLYSTDENKSLIITEIPIGVGITDYKEFLENLVENNNYNIIDCKNNSTDTNANFSVIFKDTNYLNDFLGMDTLKILKLTKSISTKNYHLITENGSIMKYASSEEILTEFIKLRLKYNTKRREYLMNMYFIELKNLENKIRFLKEIMNGELIIYKKTKTEIETLLTEKKYDKDENTFNYLIGMPIYSFTKEKLEKLNKEYKIAKSNYINIKNKDNKQILVDDLEKLNTN